MGSMQQAAMAELMTARRGPESTEPDFWTVFERMPGPALLLDDHRRVRRANPVAVAALADSAGPLIGRRLDDLIDPIDRETVALQWRRFLRDRSASGSFVLASDDGAVSRLRLHLSAGVAPGMHVALGVVAPAVRAGDAPVELDGRIPTGRERQVLWLLADGATGSQIAFALGITEQTVQKHMANAKRKLGATTRAQMVTLAMRYGELARLLAGERLTILQILRGEDGRYVDVCARYISSDTLAAYPQARAILGRPYADAAPGLTGTEFMDAIRRAAHSGTLQEFSAVEIELPWEPARNIVSGAVEPLPNDRLSLTLRIRPA
ncbi:unannotated protein [freshwater metagenome]|uniref:Unannotated protein n=1 Tax=freshwater metagenome TaxID=449393 RepID=A0A6J7D7T0_9ZZZZ|nr:PAS domain-containing protein [Actinomycetota bacterium]